MIKTQVKTFGYHWNRKRLSAARWRLTSPPATDI